MKHAILPLLALIGSGLTACANLPATGDYGVGRASLIWKDPDRREAVTPTQDDRRELPVVIWYPAAPGSGAHAPYFPGLSSVSRDLVKSGQFSRLETFGVGLVSTREQLNAPLAPSGGSFPVVILSPGNGTNVEMYDAIAGELASRGYVVAGLNHPYDVSAVRLSDGSVARFVEGPLNMDQHRDWIAARVEVRVGDVELALKRLSEMGAPGDPFPASRLDLAHIGVMGHSLGGNTAAQACYADPRIAACANLDGLQRGGPFGVAPVSAPPTQPFLFVTKEQTLADNVTAMLTAGGARDYLVITPGAAHQSFADSDVLQPAFTKGRRRGLPVMRQIRAYTVAFFDRTLKGSPAALLDTPRDTSEVRYRPAGR